MKLLRTYNSQLEAELVLQYLRSNGISAYLNGSRDYASIVVGSDLGTFKVEVLADEYDRAKTLLEENQHPSLELVISEDTKRSDLKKAISFSLFGLVMFPIFFNVLSIKPYIRFMHSNERSTIKIFWSILYFGLQIATLALVFFISTSFLIDKN